MQRLADQSTLERGHVGALISNARVYCFRKGRFHPSPSLKQSERYSIEAHFERIFSIIDGNRTSPGVGSRSVCSSPSFAGAPLATTPVEWPVVPSSIDSTPVRNVDPCNSVCSTPWQPFLPFEGNSFPVLHPVSERLRNASTMSRFRQVCNGPRSKVGHFLLDNSMSTF